MSRRSAIRFEIGNWNMRGDVRLMRSALPAATTHEVRSGAVLPRGNGSVPQVSGALLSYDGTLPVGI